MVYEFLAPGFEETEAVIPVDVLRRGGVEIQTVSITDALTVAGAHGVCVAADILLSELSDADLMAAELLMLPGGMPGTSNLDKCERLTDALVARSKQQRLIGAICAAPIVLGRLGLLQGETVTCYPGFEHCLDGADYTGRVCVVSRHIVTAEGPAAAFHYAYTLLEMLKDKETADRVAHDMRYTHLIQSISDVQ
jgi:4-methyl-5(b-hydroxyethyl)-thiazole monophosphate biosynthesis